MRRSFTMWGGGGHPIVPIGNAAEARALLDLFRVDALVTASDTAPVTRFVEAQTHLPWPLLGKELFKRRSPRLVDLEHPIALLDRYIFRDRAEATRDGASVDMATWDPTDPLADVFLATFGALPEGEESRDYTDSIVRRLMGRRITIQKDGVVPPFEWGRMPLASVQGEYLEQHYAVRNSWRYPGFYVGEASNFDDLVAYWNIKAAGVDLLFFDPSQAARYEGARPAWIDRVQRFRSEQDRNRGIALWHRRERPLEADLGFAPPIFDCAVDPALWNGLNLRAPIQYFAERSALATVDDRHKAPTAAFALADKPFSDVLPTTGQHFVLSVDPLVDLPAQSRATLRPPFVPALNPFLGRTAFSSSRHVRAEPAGLGFITSADTEDISISAVDTTALIAAIFETVGIKATPSKAGLVGTTLIHQMGGLNGCRPFKISGVRTLIERHRPDDTFSRSDAMQTIRAAHTPFPLSAYQWLHIEQRPAGAELKNSDVLGYLLDHGVFRGGLNFACPNCQLTFWKSLEEAAGRLECEYCGHSFNVARQLKDKDWAFRRSGLFGRDDNQEGALPVTLTLQQLVRHGGMRDGELYCTGMDLTSLTASIRTCETDFVVIASHGREERVQVAIGECKTRKPITADDVAKLKAVADAFPSARFNTFIVFSKLAPFTEDEIALIKPLNDGPRLRAILLTDRELEPYFTYERTKIEFDIDEVSTDFNDMANITDAVFFQNRRRAAAAET
ncbi:hypothetical protein DSM104635_01737 [Terricaulis silvestris]|uniref:Uncharacterized protein n=2 Tax=Terricaulis silvestris TaxID=2686094 RepID=A0A6I6MT84_9CAUL|nr:hypothetical protein DSM104635_01737 [Terricaulis silvestris]